MLGSERVNAERQIVEEINQIVDGLPLALDIIARVLEQNPTLSVADYLAAMRDEEQVLEHLQDWEQDNRSVYAAFEVSYQRLSEVSQILLASLSSLTGALFSRPLITAVASIPKLQLHRALSQLHGRSLLIRNTEQQHERYQLTNLMRQFAQAKAKAANLNSADLQTRLFTYLIDFAAQNQQAYHILDQEADYLLHALQEAVTDQHTAWLEALCHHLTHPHLGLVGYLDRRGLWEEADTFFHALKSLTVSADDDVPENPLLLFKLGAFAYRRHDAPAAMLYLRQCLNRLDVVPVIEESAILYMQASELLAQLLFEQQGAEPAILILQKGLAIAQQFPAVDAITHEAGYVRIRLGITQARTGDLEEGYAHISLGLSQLPQQNPSPARITALMALGNIALYEGQTETAQLHWEMGLAEAEAITDQRRLVMFYQNLAVLHGETGEIREALLANEQALALYRDLGDADGQAGIHANLAQEYMLLRQYAVARTHIERALTLADTHQLPTARLYALVNLVRWSLDQQAWVEAKTILANAEALNGQLNLADQAGEIARYGAELLWREGQTSEALAQIEQLLSQARDEEDETELGFLYRLQGNIWREQGQFAEALVAYKASIKAFGDYRQLETARSRLLFAECALAVGNPEASIAQQLAQAFLRKHELASYFEH